MHGGHTVVRTYVGGDKWPCATATGGGGEMGGGTLVAGILCGVGIREYAIPIRERSLEFVMHISGGKYPVLDTRRG